MGRATNMSPADTLINDLSLSDSEDDDEDGTGAEEVGGGGGGGSLDQDEGTSNDTGSAKAAKRDSKDEEDNSDNLDGKDKTDAESDKSSEEEDFDSDLEKSLKRRREESNEERQRIPSSERKRLRNIFEKGEQDEIESRSNEDWALLSLESEEEDDDNVEKDNVEEEDKWKSTIGKLKTIVKVRMHQKEKEMYETKTIQKEDESTNGVEHDEIVVKHDEIVVDDNEKAGFHFEKEFELKKTKVDLDEKMDKVELKKTRRKGGGWS